MSTESSIQILKEICATHFAQPVFTNIQDVNSTSKKFKVQVKFHLNGMNIVSVGDGKSPNEAKEKAATMALNEVYRLDLCSNTSSRGVIQSIIPSDMERDRMSLQDVHNLLTEVENLNLDGGYNNNTHAFEIAGKEKCAEASKILVDKKLKPEARVKRALKVLGMEFDIREIAKPGTDTLYILVIPKLDPPLHIGDSSLRKLYLKTCEYLLVLL